MECSIEGRDGKRLARGWCSKHYQRWKANGDPLARRPAPNAPKDHPDGDRTCRTCAVKLPLAHFDRDTAATRGRRADCKQCRGRYEARRYQSQREKIIGRITAYRKTNPERVREIDSERYFRHRRQRVALASDVAHRARAATRGAETESGITVDVLREAQGDRCTYCDVEMIFESTDLGPKDPRLATLDHVLPISRGGAHVWENVVIACSYCNASKGAKTLEEWKAALAA